jgi:hypothetical protein
LVFSILYSVPRGPSLDYGKLNEAVARNEYATFSGSTVDECGFFVCTKKDWGFLGASPDGLVGENKIIEIKCPYSARYLHPLDIPKNIKTFYCSLDHDGKLKLNKKHNYFFQIQGQLFVTKRKYCDFIVWTPKGINVETIVADDQFMKNILPKLKDFYYKHYGPELVDNRHERNMKLRDTN